MAKLETMFCGELSPIGCLGQCGKEDIWQKSLSTVEKANASGIKHAKINLLLKERGERITYYISLHNMIIHCETNDYSNPTLLMLTFVRALAAFDLMKNTPIPWIASSEPSVKKSFGLVGLMETFCAPPGPSRTCSTKQNWKYSGMRNMFYIVIIYIWYIVEHVQDFPYKQTKNNVPFNCYSTLFKARRFYSSRESLWRGLITVLNKLTEIIFYYQLLCWNHF